MKDPQLQDLQEELEGKAIPDYLQPFLKKLVCVVDKQSREIRRLERLLHRTTRIR